VVPHCGLLALGDYLLEHQAKSLIRYTQIGSPSAPQARLADEGLADIEEDDPDRHTD
jgi:hypothetical protein